MLNTADSEGLNQFLRGRGSDQTRSSLPTGGIFSPGRMLGSWRIECLLGAGGSGEVYRVVHTVTQTAAAAKVLARDDAASKRRFQGEADFLSQNRLPQFPRFFEQGEQSGHAYLVLELLEPIDVPTDEKGIAAYLLEVSSCVRALHLSGIVHRDLKPKNIMRRLGEMPADSSIVLIDFGLAKDVVRAPRPRIDVSIVSGKAVCVGTPDYAAPEQLTGGEISPAADIHALGRIAHTAFGGNPPPTWEPIIRRATSSIPAQRYATVDDFAAAIRKRNRGRALARLGLVAAGVALIAALLIGRDALPIVRDVSARMRFNALGETVQTNVVERQLLWERVETNGWGRITTREQAFGSVTNAIDITLVRLACKTNVFSCPLRLKSNHEYWILGPGILDAPVVSEGTNTTVRLRNCVFRNRSTAHPDESGICYVFQGGACLDFTEMDRPQGFSPTSFEDFDAACDDVRFRDD